MLIDTTIKATQSQVIIITNRILFMVPWFLVVPAGPDHQLLPERNKKIRD